MSNFVNNPSTREEFQQNVDFQMDNVKGWLSVNDYESALIKAKCLVDALERIVAFDLQGKCLECGKVGATIRPPDQYEGWCMECARSDAMADSDAYDYRTEQLEGNGW